MERAIRYFDAENLDVSFDVQSVGGQPYAQSPVICRMIGVGPFPYQAKCRKSLVGKLSLADSQCATIADPLTS